MISQRFDTEIPKSSWSEGYSKQKLYQMASTNKTRIVITGLTLRVSATRASRLLAST